MNKTFNSRFDQFISLINTSFNDRSDIFYIIYNALSYSLPNSSIAVFSIGNSELSTNPFFNSNTNSYQFNLSQISLFFKSFHSSPNEVYCFSETDIVKSKFNFFLSPAHNQFSLIYLFFTDTNSQLLSFFVLDLHLKSIIRNDFSSSIQDKIRQLYKFYFFTNSSATQSLNFPFSDLIQFPSFSNLSEFSYFSSKFLSSQFSICSVSFLFLSKEGSKIFTNIYQPYTKTCSKVIIDHLTLAASFFSTYISQFDYDVHHFFSSLEDKSYINDFDNFSIFPLIFNHSLLGFVHLVFNNNDNISSYNGNTIKSFLFYLSSNLFNFFRSYSLSESYLSSLINFMQDAVFFVDTNHKISLFNNASLSLFNFPNNSDLFFNEFFTSSLLPSHYSEVFSSKRAISNLRFDIYDKFFSVNISPVLTKDNLIEGTLFVFRDITKLLRMDKLNSDRLEVISKVNLIIKSITNLNQLLAVLLQLMLDTSHAEMGSILLKENNGFHCKLHINFPEKIRKLYRFSNGQQFSDSVIDSKEPLYISDRKILSNNSKIILDWYLVLPIMVHRDLIGIVTIVKKHHSNSFFLTSEDINTLNTITSISGTAINNALFYEFNLAQQSIDNELQIARSIQEKLLPSDIPVFDFIKISVFSQPARQIGGDFFDFIKINDKKLGIVIADIVGKGVPAGLFMSLLKSVLSAHFPFFESPKDALNKVNQILYNERVIDKFIPLFYGILDLETFEFKFSNAGHEPVLLLSSGSFFSLDTAGLPLASYSDLEYEEKSLQLAIGDRLFFYTDGFLELKHHQNGFFGFENFKNSILKYSSLDSQELIKKLSKHILNFSGSSNDRDDLTLLLIDIGKKSIVHHHQILDQFKIKVKSQKANIKQLRDSLHVFLDKIGCEKQFIHDLKLVLNEAHANIIEHAYLDSPDEDILFSFFHYESYVKIKIRDYGKKFDYSKINEKTPDFINLEGSGFGLFLIKTLVDEVSFVDHNRGTEMVLIRYLK